MNKQDILRTMKLLVLDMFRQICPSMSWSEYMVHWLDIWIE